jgi:hypothetical protein
MKLFLLFVIVASVQSDYVPKFFKNLGSFGIVKDDEMLSTKTYYLSHMKLNWIEASLTCRSYGMDLWSVDTREEWDYIQYIFLKNIKDFEIITWIAGSKLGGDEWYWINKGEPFQPDTFEWANNEPSGGSDELCTNMFNEDNVIKMNDAPCRSNHMFKFMCVKTIATHIKF